MFPVILKNFCRDLSANKVVFIPLRSLSHKLFLQQLVCDTSRPHVLQKPYRLATVCSRWYSTDDVERKNDEKEVPEQKKNSAYEAIVKVLPKAKKKETVDFSKAFYDNNLITPIRAMDELLLTSDDMKHLMHIKRRSPFPETADMVVLLRKDVEKLAVEKYGSLEKMQTERQKQLEKKLNRRTFFSNEKPPIMVHKYSDTAYYKQLKQKESVLGTFKHGSGRVVLYAIVINSINCVLKFGAWLYTGSHSMFSEFLHSLADTVNQIVLAFGISQSLKKADLEHPYGRANFRNVASLISGLGIFFVGAGLSFYHGFQGFHSHVQPEPLFWAIGILGGSFVSEAATLLVAVNQIRESSKARNLGFFEYVWRSEDPSTNVVLLEDFAAVIGVSIAAGCMSLSYIYHSAIPDALGSILIGGLLASVASFIVFTNTQTLIGRSIHPIKKQQMMKDLESDRIVRALHDVKATDIGANIIRFKAEVDFDGKEITRKYLSKDDTDLDEMLKEATSLQNSWELENFMIKHGENIVDTMGSEVDRIERKLKSRHPELRHVDLEQL